MNRVALHRAIILILLVPSAQMLSAAQERGVGVMQSRQRHRIALVIGNSAYSNAPLLNPVNDARAMQQQLAAMGFEVLYGENLTQNQLKEQVRQLGQKLKSGGVGLFYFAGHGVQVGGKNYLIPVGAAVTAEQEVEYESVDVGRVLSAMESAGNEMNIIILDACRSNPFVRSYRSAANGLASVEAPTGSLIAYATAPGAVASDGQGQNGLYTQELLKAMREPGLTVEHVFKRVRVAVRKLSGGKQVPWESSSLIGDFYFLNGINSSNTLVSPPITPPVFFQQSYTFRAWRDRGWGASSGTIYISSEGIKFIDADAPKNNLSFLCSEVTDVEVHGAFSGHPGLEIRTTKRKDGYLFSTRSNRRAERAIRKVCNLGI